MIATRNWLSMVRRYFAVIAMASLLWEVTQLPLYTLWQTGSWNDIAFAVIHCTGGDVLIAGASLFGSLLLFGAADWPRSRFMPVASLTVVFGLGFTIYSEHVNTARNVWTYSGLMPTLPVLGTGLAPLAQWVVVPMLAFATCCPTPRQKDVPTRLTQELDLTPVAILTPTVRSDHSACAPRRLT